MTFFQSLSSQGDKLKKKERHKRSKPLRPMLQTWSTIERSLSVEERKSEGMFFIQSGILSLVILVFMGFIPYFQGQDIDFWPKSDFVIFYSDDFTMAEDGFFGKTSIPSVDGSFDRTRVEEVTEYIVQGGDNLWKIAGKFDISVQTIEDNNELARNLQPGDKLKILPVDGILYTIKSGDTLSVLAKKYDIAVDEIVNQNDLLSDASITAGQVLILPGAEKIYEGPQYIAKNPSSGTGKVKGKTTSSGSASHQPKGQYQSTNIPPSSTAKPARGKFVFPAKGSITQYYHRGHYAIDVADRSKPPIWAVADGTVERVSLGCRARQTGCNYGYGNYIIINHGNGLKTLYAHNEVVHVKKGQKVKAGQSIAKMGNTGTVYGVTGIHLHFEVHNNGKKENPMKYF